jgi:very-short-patch-repair endonuclease
MSTEEQRRREAKLHALLRRQDGVISLDQARELGFSDATVRRRVATKQWYRIAYRVYLVATHEETPRATVRAAMLSVGGDAVLVGRAAAWWWGLLHSRPAPIEIAVDRERQQRRRPGVLLVRRTVPETDRTVLRRLRVTTIVPTVLDAAAERGPEDGARLMDTALQRRKVTLEALRRAQVKRSGRHGSPVTWRLLALAAGGAVSEAERLAHSAMRAAGIGGWLANVPMDVPGFGRAVVDVAFPAEKVILEIDGWAFHRDVRAFLIDGPRQAALTAEGWVVIRTHWYELTENPEVFVATLRRVLASRSGRP